VRKAVAAKMPASDPALPILDPGQSCTITFAITPSAPPGATVNGHLHIQTLAFFAGTTNDLVIGVRRQGDVTPHIATCCGPLR
jgi:hypothetical protein